MRAGQADPAARAALAKRRMRSKLPLLEQALTGIVRNHHRQLLAVQLAHIDFFWGIRLRRDSGVSVRYAEALHSTTSSVTLQSPDRHGILGPKPTDVQMSWR